MTGQHRASAAIPLTWCDDEHAALAWRHGLALCRALAAEGVSVTACVVTEKPLPAGAEQSLRVLSERHGVATEWAPAPPTRLEGNLYTRLAYRFYLWARDRADDAIHATDLFGLPYYCLLDRVAGRGFTRTAFAILTLGPSRALLLDRGLFPDFDTLSRLHLEDGCLTLADRVSSVMEAALPGIELPRVETFGSEPEAGESGTRILVIGEGVSPAELRFVDKALTQALPHLQSPVTVMVIDAGGDEELASPSLIVPPLALAGQTTTTGHGDAALADALRKADIAILPAARRDVAWLGVLCRVAGLPVVGRGHADLAGLGPNFAPSGPPADLAGRLIDALSAPAPAPLLGPSLWLGSPAALPPEELAEPALVSVCVTHFNRPHLLRRALSSLAAQDYPALEIILVDDGSDTPEALECLAALERDPPTPRFRLIRQPNRYLGAARNAAAAAAAGPYLLFMDDDNLAKPEELSVLVAAARSSDADIVTCFNDTFSREEDGGPVVESRRLFLGSAAGVGVLFNVFGDANALIRAETFRRLGGFSEDYGVGHEDYEFFARAVLNGARLLTVPEALFWYRTDDASMIKTTALGLNHARALRPYLADGAMREGPLAGDLATLARGAFIRADHTVALLQADGQRKQQAIETLTTANAEKQQAIATLEAENVEKQRAIAALEAANVEKQRAITALESVSVEKQSVIAALEAENTEKQRAVATLEAANAEKQQAIVALETANAEKQQAIVALETANAEKQQAITVLETANTEKQQVIAALHASWSWRATGPFRRAARLARRVVGLFACRPRGLTLTPNDSLTKEGDLYRSANDDPQFFIRPVSGRMPSGWVVLSYAGQGIDFPLTPELFIDAGAGLSEAGKLSFPPLREGRVRQILRLPDGVRGLRFDPMARPGRFRLDTVEAISCGGLTLLAFLLARRPSMMLAGILRGPRRLAQVMDEAIRLENAAPALTYEDWVACFDILTDEDQKTIQQRGAALKTDFTVVIPAHNAAFSDLADTIASLRSQLYPHWRLIILAPHEAAGDAVATLAHDPRVSVITEADALIGADGWLVFVDPATQLAPHALYMVAHCLAADPKTEILYADEDRLDSRKRRVKPDFKPDWSPDLFLARNYLGPLVVLRRALLDASAISAGEDIVYATVLRRMSVGPEPVVRHAPFVLSHRTADEGMEKPRRGREHALLTRHLTPQGARVEPWLNGTANHIVYALPERAPFVSIIVPTKDKIDLLRLCVESLRERTVYPGGFEILVIDNRSETDEARAYFAELERTGAARVLAYDAPFNYSAINNFGVRHAKGEVLAFLNNDIEAIAPSWLAEMTAHALRPEIGAVGTMLYYPDDTIQHAGVGLGLHTLVGHLHRGLPRGATGYADRAALTQNMSAVTAACLVIRRSVFEAVGGFEEEHLHVAFNDVDLCLRLRAAGHRLVWTPHAEMYHHEGASRGRVEKPERLAQFAVEIAYMTSRWADIVSADPYYSPNLTLDAEDCGLGWPPRVTPPWRLPTEPAPTKGARRSPLTAYAWLDTVHR
jgi:O-antigen biosynthesis protein